MNVMSNEATLNLIGKGFLMLKCTLNTAAKV